LKIQTYLIDNGIEKERVVYEGYGEANPIFPNNNEINKAKNRRVEIEIISKK
jgi:outer membrane protein OmpA-like peptidoglycan-associated protein